MIRKRFTQADFDTAEGRQNAGYYRWPQPAKNIFKKLSPQDRQNFFDLLARDWKVELVEPVPGNPKSDDVHSNVREVLFELRADATTSDCTIEATVYEPDGTVLTSMGGSPVRPYTKVETKMPFDQVGYQQLHRLVKEQTALSDEQVDDVLDELHERVSEDAWKVILVSAMSPAGREVLRKQLPKMFLTPSKYATDAQGNPLSKAWERETLDKNMTTRYNGVSVDRDSPTQGGAVAQQNKVVVKQGDSLAEKYVDVMIHGHRVRLDVLKEALRLDKKLSQTKLADMTAKYNDGVALHQTTVSAYLSGHQAMSMAFHSVLQEVFSEDEARDLANRIPISEPKQNPRVRKKGSRGFPKPANPPFAKDLNVIPGEDLVAEDEVVEYEVVEDTPVTTPVGIKVPSFPVDKAWKVANMVRQGAKEGSITTTFSLRKLMMWGEAYYLLMGEGFEQKEALSGAFHLAAEGRTFGEDAMFLKNAFNQVFGFEVKPPRVHANTARANGNRHPQDYLVEPLVRECKPVWMYGPTGAGKSHSSKEIPRRLGRPWMRIQGSYDSTVNDLVGGPIVRDRNTYFEYGPLPMMMRAGGVLIIDEVTLYPQEVLMELQAVLEGEPLVLKRNNGEVVFPKEGFTIIVTDNSLGLGEATEYIGTQVMNESFRDRFFFVHYDYMPESQEKLAVEQYLDSFLDRKSWVAV